MAAPGSLIGGKVAKRIEKSHRAPKASRGRKEQKTPAVPRTVPDLSSIMTHFNEALSPIILCQRSLVEVDNAVHEEAVLRASIELLRQVYEEIDAAEQVIYAASKEGKQAG
jgi:hypothetical protein